MYPSHLRKPKRGPAFASFSGSSVRVGRSRNGNQLGRCESVFVCVCQVTLAVSDSLRPHELQPARLLCPWNSPGENAAVGCYPSNKSSWPGDQTHVSALAGGFFTTEPPGKPLPFYFSLLGLSGPQPLNGPFWRRTLSL